MSVAMDAIACQRTNWIRSTSEDTSTGPRHPAGKPKDNRGHKLIPMLTAT